MTRMDIRNRNNILLRCCVILLLSALGCNPKDRSSQRTAELSQDSLLLISEEWKMDSLGCEQKRNARKIEQLIDQFRLIGKDTITIIQYLGKPNHKEYHKNNTIYYYYLECGEAGKVSYDNFYCYFRGDSLFSFQRMTF